MSLIDPDDRRGSSERWLAARLHARHFHGLRLASLQTMALCSLPLWPAAYGLRVPALVTWFGLLLAATFLVLAAGYAWLELRWSRRARQAAPSSRIFVHVAHEPRYELRARLWCGLSAASLFPWASCALGRPLPGWLLGPLTGSAAFLVAAIAATEAIRATLRPSPKAEQWLDHMP
jgi:hypothetical protein